MAPKPEVILFDLGGVLADLGSPATGMGLAIDDAAFWKIWIGSPTARALENGQLEEWQFLQRFPGELGLTDGPREFLERFWRWRLTLYPEILPLLRSLKPRAKLALLSNTNSLHWHMVTQQAPLPDLLDAVFLSFELGLSKPDAGIFQEVTAKLDLPPGKVFFLDDSALNVEAARAVGLRSAQVSGVAEMMAALQRAGF